MNYRKNFSKSWWYRYYCWWYRSLAYFCPCLKKRKKEKQTEKYWLLQISRSLMKADDKKSSYRMILYNRVLISNELQNIWYQLKFSFEVMHNGKGLASVLQGCSASIGEAFILVVGGGAGSWAASLWGLDTFLIFPSFLEF